YVHAVRVPPGDRFALSAAFQGILDNALAPIAGVIPARLTMAFGELLYVILTTHPDAVRLVDRIFDPRPRLGGETSPEAVAAKVAAEVALAITRFRPREDAKAIRAKARKAAARAIGELDASDEIPLANACWAAAIVAAYTQLSDVGEPRATVLK